MTPDPDRLGLALNRLVAEVEELPEQRVVRQRVILTYFTAYRDADDRGRNSAHNTGNARDRRTSGFGNRGASERRGYYARCQKYHTRQDERWQNPLH